MTKRKLTTIEGVYFRAPTGPLRIGTDWPGVFFRGDEAMAWKTSLERAARVLTKLAKTEKAPAPSYELAALATRLRELNRMLSSAKVDAEGQRRITREKDLDDASQWARPAPQRF